MTVSMLFLLVWCCTPDWNMLNKSESFMAVIIQANAIEIGLSKGLSKAQGWEGAYKKAYVGGREMRLWMRI